MRFSIFAIALVAVSSFALSPSTSAGEILNLGDPAPPLTVSTWIKGDKFEKFEPGKTYIVEFWATWCGPCRASIPHLTELAHQYKDQGVRVLGVDVWEQDPSRVEPFVTELGDQMDYAVALDSTPPGGTGDDGKMATNWLAAAVEDGIPTAFVIHDAKIAWIGHPLRMDEPLAKIIAGTWDAKSLAAERLVEKAKEKKLMTARERIFKPYRAKDYQTTLALIDEEIKENPELAEELARLKFAVLNYTSDVDQTLALGTKLFAAKRDDPFALNAIAWAVVNPDRDAKPDARLAQLGLEAAKRAVELSMSADYNSLDTLACAYYASGDYSAAISTQEQALRILKEKSEGQPNGQIEIFTKRLDLFRAALKEKPTQPQ
jgi:thiol-disulfide isomerase/thioredoxin